MRSPYEFAEVVIPVAFAPSAATAVVGIARLVDLGQALGLGIVAEACLARGTEVGRAVVLLLPFVIDHELARCGSRVFLVERTVFVRVVAG